MGNNTKRWKTHFVLLRLPSPAVPDLFTLLKFLQTKTQSGNRECGK
jgi:hypothetical protein